MVQAVSYYRPPARSDLDPPLDIPQLIANIILIDLLDDEYRYRLIGSGSTESPSRK